MDDAEFLDYLNQRKKIVIMIQLFKVRTREYFSLFEELYSVSLTKDAVDLLKPASKSLQSTGTAADAEMHCDLACYYLLAEKPAEAQRLLDQVQRTLLRSVNDRPPLEARVEANIAIVQHRQGKTAEAKASLESAIKRAHASFDNNEDAAWAWLAIAKAAPLIAPREQQAAFEKAIALIKTRKSAVTQVRFLLPLAKLQKASNPQAAEKTLDDAVEAALIRGVYEEQIEALYEAAVMYVEFSKPDKARPLFTELEKLFTKSSDKGLVKTFQLKVDFLRKQIGSVAPKASK